MVVSAEINSSSHATTYTSDGFTLTGTSGHMNASDTDYVYAAFA